MLTYEEICNKYKQMKIACLNNKNILAKQIDQLFIYIKNDLGLSGRVWKDSDGSLNTYINILDLSKSSPFRSDAASLNYQFKGNNPSCDFGIEFILEQAKNSYPKAQYYIKVKARFDDGNIVMAVEKNGEFIQFNIDPYDSNKFGEISRCIKQTLFESLS